MQLKNKTWKLLYSVISMRENFILVSSGGAIYPQIVLFM